MTRTTDQRGYGRQHQLTRARLVRELRANPGQPCPRCHLPMFATAGQAEAAGMPEKLWDLHLGDWPGLAIGGPQIKRLEHAYCNTRAGAIFGNTLRAVRKPRRGRTRTRDRIIFDE